MCLFVRHPPDPQNGTAQHSANGFESLWITPIHSSADSCSNSLDANTSHKKSNCFVHDVQRNLDFAKKRNAWIAGKRNPVAMCGRLGPPLRTETAARGAVYLCWWQQHRVTAPDRLPPPPCPWLEVSGTGCAKHQHLTKISPLLSVFSAMRANCPLFYGKKTKEKKLWIPLKVKAASQPYRTEFLLRSVRNVFYPSKFGAFYVYFQPVSPARTAWF